MEDRLSTNPVPIQLPIGKESEFIGIIDLLIMKAMIYKDDLGEKIDVVDIPEDMMELAEEYREKLIESISDYDEAIMEKFLEGEEIGLNELKAAIRLATLNVDIIPVVCGSSYKNKGVQLVLDAIVDYMPSPLDVPAITGINPDTEEEDSRKASDDEPFSGIGI